MSIFKFKTQNKKFKTAERTNTENEKNMMCSRHINKTPAVAETCSESGSKMTVEKES